MVAQLYINKETCIFHNSIIWPSPAQLICAAYILCDKAVYQISSIITVYAEQRLKGRWAGSSTLKLLSFLYPTPWK
jgi:hypothetical protein